MSGVDSLESLRKRVRLRGQKVGANKCVWADGFAMETIANHFQLLLLVVDERSSQKFIRIAPALNGSSGDTIPSSQATVLLHASQREHMNLICYNGRRMSPVGQLPRELQQLWNLTIAPDTQSSVQLRSPRQTASGQAAASGKRKLEASDSCVENGRLAATNALDGVERAGSTSRGGLGEDAAQSGRGGRGCRGTRNAHGSNVLGGSSTSFNGRNTGNGKARSTEAVRGKKTSETSGMVRESLSRKKAVRRSPRI